MYRSLCFIALALAAYAAGAATVQIPGVPNAARPGCLAEQYFPVDGALLSDLEAEEFSGGNVYVDMDDERTSITVRVYDPQPDERPWGARPDEIYTLPISARIEDTISAPFYPTAESARATAGMTGLTISPEEFPDGLWTITGVRADSGRYGPYFINTNAVGIVDVYRNGRYIGEYADTGYAGHSNPKELYGLTDGCFLLTKQGDAMLAQTLLLDRALAAAIDTNTVQSLRVQERDMDRDF